MGFYYLLLVYVSFFINYQIISCVFYLFQFKTSFFFTFWAHTPFNARNLIKSVVVPAATIAASAAGYDGPIGQAMAQQGANALIDGSLNAANIGIGLKKRGRRPVP